MKLKIALVVDDVKSICSMLRETLEGARYKVMMAENGREAAKILRTGQHLDLVITDLIMPEVDGFELMAILRRDRPGVKIVAITGGNWPDILQAASFLGADATLMKPFPPERLLECVGKLMI